jgi:transcriptional regulator with XRE-family HTH domain
MGTIPQSKGLKTRVESNGNSSKGQTLHRIRDIRAQQEVTLRAMARKMHVPMREVRAQEDPTCDLPLTALYRWQQALRVPAAEILVEPGDNLSSPVNVRARLLRMMKTIVTILDKPQPERTANLLENLRNEILAVMPEIENIDRWHGSSSTRSADDIAAAVLRQIDEELLRDG